MNESIERVDVSAFRVPTDEPESDGTLTWDSTTLIVAHVTAGGLRGMGFTYADATAAHLIKDRLGPLLVGRDALAIQARWQEMRTAVRNVGLPGIAATAISALDNALWDLKAKHFRVPLAALLGAARTSIPVYGSGGFTSYTAQELEEQLCAWVDNGIGSVKMKVGRDPAADGDRVRGARKAIGRGPRLFVDANGAYRRKQALDLAHEFAQAHVSWLEEPVSSADLSGLHFIRDTAPDGMAVTAGEYAYTLDDARRLLEAQAVDVLQADATRCCGITGFLGIAALCQAFAIPLSSHCAPSLHVHAMCSVQPALHLEYFVDHDRIEHLLFEGSPSPREGRLAPDWSRPGLGVELNQSVAERYRIG